MTGSDVKFYYAVSETGAIIISCTVDNIPAYPCTMCLDGLGIKPPEGHVVVPIDLPPKVREKLNQSLVEHNKEVLDFNGKKGQLVELKKNWDLECEID